MKKKSRLDILFDAIIDRNLYGRGFLYRSIYYLAFGLFVQSLIHFLLNRQLLIIYVPSYVVLILVTATLTKNLTREVHPMASWLAYLLLFTSALSKTFAYVVQFPNVYPFFSPDTQRLSVLFISEGALLASLITIVVLGQRASLRNSVGLTDKFFDKEKSRWRSEVEDFPNFGKILKSLDGGRFVADIFDKGFFNLTILWSCNVMEEVIDAIAEGIIDKNPKKKLLFRNEKGFRLPYPTQMRNLEYEFCRKNQNKVQLTVEDLWQKVRNKIAHHNYRPTFDETNETLKILISFVRETPNILQEWSST